ncbi:hypothetical protein AALA61_14640, partial [Oscillospiraceae bacterium 42-9]
MQVYKAIKYIRLSYTDDKTVESDSVVPAFAVDIVHEPCDFFLGQLVKGAALGQHDADILVAA